MKIDMNIIDDIRKYYGTIDGKQGTVTYDGEQFIVPLSQEDTFHLNGEQSKKYQARVKFNDDSVQSTKIYVGYITDSISSEVL